MPTRAATSRSVSGGESVLPGDGPGSLEDLAPGCLTTFGYPITIRSI